MPSFEALGTRNHSYTARVLSAIAASLAAYTHHWLALVILAAITLLYVLVRRDSGRQALVDPRSKPLNEAAQK